MEIRKTLPEELAELEVLYASARAFMARSGNPTQWGRTEPPTATLKEDIAKGQSYVCVEGGEIVGTFCFFVGEEPTYLHPIAGAWLNEEPYGVIHRVASAGTVKGVTAACVDWCWRQWPNLRIDTHDDNAPMQRAILRCGFTEVGRIRVADGSERRAYHKVER